MINGQLAKKDSGSPAARVRSYFPEALYINPEIITDKDGRASIVIPMADSITTWRMAMIASTQHGALGTSTSSLKVFQDFFVDLDLPVTLTQGDRVSIPVAIYNYSGSTGDVSLHLEADNWFSLVDDVGEKSVTVDSARVGGSQFTLEAKRIGKFKLTLSARMKGGANRADIVVREIEVIPNGREQNLVFNGRLENTVQHEVDFPANAIPDASKIFVRLYPGPLSQVIEGMDSILRMPGGCFEQTSSSTYPNVLALDYMKRTKKLTPEVHAKAEGYIANGYQRLLTFEVPGGGFSWFGSAPANKILTAYGLMEFYDMSKVYDVDPKLISRTQQWLAGQQQADGSWKPDTSFINEGATNRYNSDVLRITAYIAWSLENTGYQGPAVEQAKQFVEKHMSAKMDAYTLAVVANFAADYRNRERPRIHAAGDATSAGRAHGERRTGLVERGGNRRLCHRRKRQRGDHRTGGAGAAQVGRGVGHGAQGSELHRLQERRGWNLGHNPGDDHGAACFAPRHRKRRGRRSRHAGGSAQRQARRKAHLDAGEQRSAPSVRVQGHRFAKAPAPSKSGSRGRAVLPTRSWGATSSPGIRSRRTSRSPSMWLTTARTSRRTTLPRQARRSGTT